LRDAERRPSPDAVTGDSLPAVKINNLTRVFRLPALRRREITAVADVSLTVGVGEVYGLIGPNGSGKSTTMKVLLGLLRATKGTCQIFGRDSAHVDSREDVGYLPENPYFYKHLSGHETLTFYGKLCGLRGAELEQRIDEMLELVDLKDARDRRLGGYSKGMLQRIGLAQAIIHRPRLIVLDEPTAGVDPRGSREIRDLILELKRRGISIILSSHLLEQVEEVCDRIGIIFRGRMVVEGPMRELTRVEEQTEILLRHADPSLLASLEKTATAHGAEWISAGHPRTTLERLFLEVTDRAAAEEKQTSRSA
jgi:ABC-2 type transport system ATP-binding protein